MARIVAFCAFAYWLSWSLWLAVVVTTLVMALAAVLLLLHVRSGGRFLAPAPEAQPAAIGGS